VAVKSWINHARTPLAAPGFRAVVAVAVLAAVGAVGGQPGTATAFAPGWHRYVLGPSSRYVSPVDAQSRGSVGHLRTLLAGRGRPTTLTTVAGGTPASVVLDFGKDVAGTPFVDVTSVTGSPALNLVTGESRQFLRRPAATAVPAGLRSIVTVNGHRVRQRCDPDGYVRVTVSGGSATVSVTGG
jgi:hypothetical protein